MIFPYNTLMTPNEICNISMLREKLKYLSEHASRVVIFGKRNTGKTSVVENVVIPHFRSKFAKTFVLKADLLGVTDQSDVTNRFAKAFSRGFSESFPSKAKINKMLDIIKGVSPSLTMNPDGSFSVGISSWANITKTLTLDLVFDQLHKLEASGIRILVVVDEFQDIHYVNGMEEVFRTNVESLPQTVGIFLLGSKKHLLAKIVADEKAPLYQWGLSVEFGPIAYEEYHEYIQSKFKPFDLKINIENCRLLQDEMQRNPEAVNMICEELVMTRRSIEIDEGVIFETIATLLNSRKSIFQERMVPLNKSDVEVMTAIAKDGCIAQPTGKAFLRRLSISKAAVSKTIRRLLDQAMVYHDPDGYRLADPLLSLYLKHYR